MSLNPRDTDSFLGDTREGDYLPKESKRAMARNLLFGAAGTAEPDSPVTEPKDNSLLKKFLESIPEVNSDKKDVPAGTALFSKVFSEVPSFDSKKKEPQFDLDEEQVHVINKYWRSDKPHKLAGYSEESYKILKVQDKFVELTSVPTLDPFVKHVNQADETATKEGFKQKMSN